MSVIIALFILLVFRELQHARQLHELCDRIKAGSLDEITKHEVMTKHKPAKPDKLSDDEEAELKRVMERVEIEEAIMRNIQVEDATEFEVIPQ